MSKYYSIDEVTKMFDIPKSTLRYWEEQGLINIERSENSYRCYTKENILQICSICVYRSLDLSIKEIKKINKMNLSEMDDLLINTEILIKNKINQLTDTLQSIQTKIRNIDEVRTLSNTLYKNGTPPFNRIVNFHPTDREYIDNFLKKQNHLAFVMTPDMKRITKYGIIDINNCDSNKILWESNDSSSEYIECILRVIESNNEVDDVLLKKHLDYIESLGKTPKQIIAQYMIFSFETKGYDYYKIWIEII